MHSKKTKARKPARLKHYSSISFMKIKMICKHQLNAPQISYPALHSPLVLVESFLQQVELLAQCWQAELQFEPYQLQLNIQMISNDKLNTVHFYAQRYWQMRCYRKTLLNTHFQLEVELLYNIHKVSENTIPFSTFTLLAGNCLFMFHFSFCS